jgi:hypothetical protein
MRWATLWAIFSQAHLVTLLIQTTQNCISARLRKANRLMLLSACPERLFLFSVFFNYLISSSSLCDLVACEQCDQTSWWKKSPKL